MHVLVVDGQEASRSFLRMVLSEFSATIGEAADIHEAQRLLQSNKFDLALIDLSPPDFIGIEALQAMRDAEANATRAPAIVFVGTQDRSAMQRAGDLGVAHFHPRPLQAFAVRDVICAVLGIEQLPITENRRSSPRLRVPVRFVFRASPDLDVLSTDLSVGGAYFESQVAPPLGTRLSATFTLPHRTDALSVMCEVVRVRMPTRGGGLAGFAVRFVELSATSREQLVDAFSLPISALPGLSMIGEAFSAKAYIDGRGMVLSMEGQADGRLVNQLSELLVAINAEMRRRSLPRVIVDMRSLEFMNSSCFKSVIAWLELVSELAPNARYEIRFLSSEHHKWQRRSLATLQQFAANIVQVDSVAQ